MSTTNAHVKRVALPGGAVMTTVRGRQPGPTLALLGGVHGDEDEGVLAVWRVLRAVESLPIRGAMRAVAPANPGAWAARRRTTPDDDADLARSFPGDRRGAPTAVVADGIVDRVIGGADLLVDLHSAGLRYSMPLFCGVGGGGLGLRAALAFGAPTIWLHDGWPAGRSLAAAMERGIPAIYAECGGGGEVRSAELDAYVTGVLSVMAVLGMVAEQPQAAPERPPRYVRGSGDLDAGVRSTRAGLFATTTAAGELVPAGGEVGRLYGYDGDLLEVVRAARPGVLMFLRRQARVVPGDVLFVSADPCEGP